MIRPPLAEYRDKYGVSYYPSLIYPLNNVNYALVLLLLTQFLFAAKLKNNVTVNQNGMPIFQYFTIMPYDLEGSL
jgi:hypothetical protein